MTLPRLNKTIELQGPGGRVVCQAGGADERQWRENGYTDITTEDTTEEGEGETEGGLVPVPVPGPEGS